MVNLDKAVAGSCRADYFRASVHRPDWEKLLSRLKAVLQSDTTDLTRRELWLGAASTSTGWYDEAYVESTIEGVIAPRTASNLLPVAGVYVRLDAICLTADGVVPGDQVVAETVYYKVETVMEHWIGRSFYFRECQLTKLPFGNLTPAHATSTLHDPRRRTKTYMDEYLNYLNLSGAVNPTYGDMKNHPFLVCYAKTNYPFERIFLNKGIEIIFAVGQPNTTPMLDVLTQAPYGYEDHIPIEILTLDENLTWMAEADLRRVAESYPTGSLRNIERMEPSTTRYGGTVIYSSKYMLNYRRDTST